MEKEKVPLHMQYRAKSIVDMLFDGHLFNDQLTRDDMNLLEDFIAEEFQSSEKSVREWIKIMEKLKHIQNGK